MPPTPRITPSIEYNNISMESQQFCFPVTPSPVPRTTPAPKNKPRTSRPSSTALAAPEHAPKSNTRTRLSPDDHLILMNHVCEHMGEYIQGKIKFWKTISQLFEEDTGLRPSLKLYTLYSNLYTGKTLKEPRLTVQTLLEHRELELKRQEKESGTKQPNTELTDRLDTWNQHLQDLEKIDAQAQASKDQKAEAKIRARDRRDDFLLGRSAKRARTRTVDDLDDATATDADDDTIDTPGIDSQSNSEAISQRQAFKRRRETPQQNKVIIQIESDDKGLSKDDWMEIMAVGVGEGNNSSLRNEMGSLRSTVEQLSSQAEQTNNLLQQLLMQRNVFQPLRPEKQVVFDPAAARYSPLDTSLPDETETEGLHASYAQWEAEQP
jgi:hypothetical protein